MFLIYLLFCKLFTNTLIFLFSALQKLDDNLIQEIYCFDPTASSVQVEAEVLLDLIIGKYHKLSGSYQAQFKNETVSMATFSWVLLGALLQKLTLISQQIKQQVMGPQYQQSFLVNRNQPVKFRLKIHCLQERGADQL